LQLITSLLQRVESPPGVTAILKGIIRVQLIQKRLENGLRSGYIHFKDNELAEKALLALRYQEIDGNPPAFPDLHLMHRVATQGDRAKVLTNQADVYVSNLDKAVTRRMLCQALEPLATVVSVRLLRNASGVSRGIAYVQFEDNASAQTVISRGNFMCLEGKQMKLEAFVPLEERKKGTRFDNVFIRNLPPGTTSEDVTELCEKHVGKVTSAYTKEDTRKSEAGEDATRRMFGAARFQDPDDAERALSILPKVSLGDGEVLFCCEHKRTQQRKREKRQIKAKREETYYGGKRNIRVEGLAAGTTKGHLQTAFSGYGAIISVCVYPKRSGKSVDGFVLFETPESAAQATEDLDNTVVPVLNPDAAVTVRIVDRKMRKK
ncbi:hypothetical protein KIPB_001549, partial [Kipferlia bialata]